MYEIKIKRMEGLCHDRVFERENVDDMCFDLFVHLHEPSVTIGEGTEKHKRPVENGADGRFVAVMPGERVNFSLGFAAAMKGAGYSVSLRSSVGRDSPFVLTNSPARIDLGYRGVWRLTLLNASTVAVVLKDGFKIAQALPTPALEVTTKYVKAVSTNTVRGAGGFGSTGN
jgi:dUTP pyrophosphatase